MFSRVPFVPSLALRKSYVFRLFRKRQGCRARLDDCDILEVSTALSSTAELQSNRIVFSAAPTSTESAAELASLSRHLRNRLDTKKRSQQQPTNKTMQLWLDRFRLHTSGTKYLAKTKRSKFQHLCVSNVWLFAFRPDTNARSRHRQGARTPQTQQKRQYSMLHAAQTASISVR